MIYYYCFMKELILLRHGQSEWNLENRFTGWTDVGLSEKGREEARRAGTLIAASGLTPRYCFTSYLRRAIQTLDIALDAMDKLWLPVVKDWRLNERHYGALQGLDKVETAARYGDEQVRVWRRSYDVAPPALDRADPRYPGLDGRYSSLAENDIPLTESLKDTLGRVRPCWEELIAPALSLHGTVFVSAHGNSLRALVMMLLGMTPEKIVYEEIPTGAPRVLSFDDGLNVVGDEYL